MYCQRIPAVDKPAYSTYMGFPPISPGASQVQNTLGTNPRCPFRVCSICANSNCVCYYNHMRDPFKHRYFVYKWNQY